MLKTPDTFTPIYTPLMTAEAHARPLLFIFRAGHLLVRESDFALPTKTVGMPSGSQSEYFHPIGIWQERYCCTTWVAQDIEPETGYIFKSLRELFDVFDEQLLGLASRAAQIAEWARTHRYCGACANPMQIKPSERAFQCSACGHIAYPRISPAMMVLIKKDDSVLLAHHGRSPSGRFTALAGFLEAGESIEDAIHREVMEEVGLTVNNINYFGSQSWPFPHSLMIAFTADYVSGEIKVDGEEITEARWFGPNDELPSTYSEVSISGSLINRHLKRKKDANA
jgi:NAD+ diphosphatase